MTDEEIQVMKDEHAQQIASLQSELEQLKANNTSLQSQLTNAEAEAHNAKEELEHKKAEYFDKFFGSKGSPDVDEFDKLCKEKFSS